MAEFTSFQKRVLKLYKEGWKLRKLEVEQLSKPDVYILDKPGNRPIYVPLRTLQSLEEKGVILKIVIGRKD